MAEKITVSIIKADVGGLPGHVLVPDEIIEVAKQSLEEAKQSGDIIDYRVLNAGDDLDLIMTHREGVDSTKIHRIAWETFEKATEKAKELKLYGAGQDLLADAFSGNVRGMGPGVAEMEFTERESEPVLAFLMDKTEPGAFNLPIFRMFADPFNTAGLVIDPSMHNGFVFEIWDIYESKRVFMKTPEEIYDILALIGGKSRFVIKRVYPKEGKLPADEPVAVISTEKLYKIAGEYVGKDDPVALVRAQSGLPAVGEVIEAFAFPHLVSGWMRGSHNGPIMPVPFRYSKCTRFDGPPRVIAAGFQLANGKLVGPVDLFDDPAFDYTRQKAMEVAEYMRRHGPFEPHRLPSEDMEYTTLPGVLKKLKERFEDV
ncbi:Archaeal fructose 1,6-bisphosphatase [Archaeoglobus sulfaticallidus PM70-1]|uniref:Fructose-1,6-bisphosphate aldolase/phosphatase n=1 Tax=Archaeoglobus sulfaticallidus PM70-1 TaxID=387631 RepID=N0BIT8_9EURY|nr:fructose-1,6-bisphosphate aldolase/phosphatase [Archaeoglobus sulfaticallidus]AGK62252.1 Archaeal fructose 1,6-bisphosphatase [Archaeoglobus sulfaticallidus PM70-1]